MISTMESGKHLKTDCVDMIEVSAFRLTPLDPHDGGRLVVDGEIVEYEAIQGRILPSAARFMGI